MNRIRSIESNEHIQGIKDKYGKQEHKANTLLKQIFWKYDYNPVKLLNFNDEILGGLFKRYNDGTDYGIDDVIYKHEIPEDDPFNLLQLRKGRSTDMYYTIDYKSNNFSGGLNSVYIKLMPYNTMKKYLNEYTTPNGKLIKPMEYYCRKDRMQCEKESRMGISSNKKSKMEKYYGNNQLLGDDNKTDYFFYMKYDKSKDNNSNVVFKLISAYLIPAEQLRNQVIDILNSILKKGDYNHPIKLRENGSYLNHKIMNAFRIREETPELISDIIKPPMDLFRPPPFKKEIHLRIPEKYLIPHIKFNSEGDIIK